MLVPGARRTDAQTPPPTPSLVDPDLTVRTAVTGLSQPVNLAFIGRNDMLVLEKAHRARAARRQRRPALAPSSTWPSTPPRSGDCSASPCTRASSKNGYVYLFWSESSTGTDTTDLASVPLLGNRVDRFVWNGSTLTHDRNLIRLRAFQADAGQPLRGNHNGGVIVFGPATATTSRHHAYTTCAVTTTTAADRKAKLYIQVGDTGRRGQMQNLEDGPFGPGMPDDQFGGPEPDNAHLTGVILRLNDDGTHPARQPVLQARRRRSAARSGANIQKIFAYGIRNGFGMDFDPVSGDLWEQENGDDSFSELNRVEPGMNSGWVQIMGPVERIAQFKEIETSPQFFGLQQIRWPPTNIADTPAGGAAPALRAARLPLQPARDGVEIRGGAGRHPVRRGQGPRVAGTRTT